MSEPEQTNIVREVNPLWWQGHEAGVAGACNAIEQILSGKDTAGLCIEPWASTRRKLLAQAQANKRLLEACKLSLAVYDKMCGIFGDKPLMPFDSGGPGSLRQMLVAAVTDAERTVTP